MMSPSLEALQARYASQVPSGQRFNPWKDSRSTSWIAEPVTSACGCRGLDANFQSYASCNQERPTTPTSFNGLCSSFRRPPLTSQCTKPSQSFRFEHQQHAASHCLDDADLCAQTGWASLPQLSGRMATGSSSRATSAGADGRLSSPNRSRMFNHQAVYAAQSQATPAEVAELNRIIEQAKQVQEQLQVAVESVSRPQTPLRGSASPDVLPDREVTVPMIASAQGPWPSASSMLHSPTSTMVCWPAGAQGPMAVSVASWPYTESACSWPTATPPLPPDNEEVDARLAALEAERARVLRHEDASVGSQADTVRQSTQDLVSLAKRRALEAEVDRLRKELATALVEKSPLKAAPETPTLPRPSLESDNKGDYQRVKHDVQVLRAEVQAAFKAKEELNRKYEEERRARLDVEQRHKTGLDTHMEDFQRLQSQYEASEKANDELREKLKQADDKLDKLQALEFEKYGWPEKIRHLRLEADKLAESLRDENTKLSAALELERSARLGSEQRQRVIEDSEARLREELEKQQRAFDDQLTKMREDVRLLQSDIDHERQTQMRAVQRYENAEALLDKLRSEQRKLQEDTKKLHIDAEEERQTVLQQQEEAQAALERVRREHRTLLEENKRLQALAEQEQQNLLQQNGNTEAALEQIRRENRKLAEENRHFKLLMDEERQARLQQDGASEAALEQMKREHRKLLEENRKLQTNFDEERSILQQGLDESEAALEKLKREERKLKEEIINLKADAEERHHLSQQQSNALVEELQRKQRKQAEENRLLQNTIDSERKLHAEGQEQSQAALEQLRREHGKAVEELKLLRRNMEEERQTHSQWQHESEALVGKLRQENRHLAEEHARLQQGHESLEARFTQEETSHGESEKKLASLQTELKRIRTQTAALEAAQEEELKSIRQASSAQLVALEAELKLIRGQKETLEVEVNKHRTSSTANEDQLRQLQQELAKEQSASKMVQKDLSEVKLELNTMIAREQALNDSLLRFSEVEKELASALAKNAQLEKDKDILETDVKHLRKADQEREKSEKSLRAALETEHQEMKLLLGQLEQAHAERDEAIARAKLSQHRQHHPSGNEEKAEQKVATEGIKPPTGTYPLTSAEPLATASASPLPRPSTVPVGLTSPRGRLSSLSIPSTRTAESTRRSSNTRYSSAVFDLTNI